MAIDLFAGAGGMTLGLKMAGFRVIGAVEADSLASESFEANHPSTRLFIKDIRRLSARSMMKDLGLKPGQLDLLAGCPPCQGFSRIKRLNGRRRNRDTGKDLVIHFLRFVKALRPKVVMMENVPHLGRDRRLRDVLRFLRSAEYQYDYGVLNAAEFGVPQRRKRFLLLASRMGKIDLPQGCRTIKTVRDAIASLPAPSRSRDALHKLVQSNSDRIRRMIAQIPKNGGSRTALPARYQLRCHRRLKRLKTKGFKDVYGRMAWNDVAPTITGGCFNPSKGRFIHPSQNRAITLREAAVLQTFPRRYKFSLRRGKTGAALLIGNAFPPRFAMHQARVARAALTKTS